MINFLTCWLKLSLHIKKKKKHKGYIEREVGEQWKQQQPIYVGGYIEDHNNFY